MTRTIRITVGRVSVTARLNDSATAEAIWQAPPIQGRANRWGDEIYFEVPVQVVEAEDARQDMAVGELGYWPSGSAMCIFFGPTPVSDGDQPRAYSNVNPFGQVEGNARVFGTVKDGDVVRVERDAT